MYENKMAENRIIQICICHKIPMLHNVSLKVISVWTKVSYNAVQEVSKWLFLSQATTRGTLYVHIVLLCISRQIVLCTEYTEHELKMFGHE